MVQDTSAGANAVMTTNGDMVYYNSGRARLAKGDNDEILTLKSGLPSWEASAGGGLWKFQGEINPSSVTNATITLSAQTAPVDGYLFCRYRGTCTSGQGFDMQVGDTGGLETGSTYDTIGVWHNTSGTSTNFYGINQVRFSFALSSFADGNEFEADCFLHVTPNGNVVTSNRMSTQIGWGTWGGINATTDYTDGISQIKIGLASSFTGNFQVWSCEKA